jgi:hypothetical protein
MEKRRRQKAQHLPSKIPGSLRQPFVLVWSPVSTLREWCSLRSQKWPNFAAEISTRSKPDFSAPNRIMGTSVSSPMPVDPPFNIYLDELSSLPHGLALWRIRNIVSIGNVGYFHEGSFICLFNVLLPCYDMRNRTVIDAKFYEPLDRNLLDITRSHFTRVQYYSRDVSAVTKPGNNMQATTPYE